jgi:hypothetical protein
MSRMADVEAVAAFVGSTYRDRYEEAAPVGASQQPAATWHFSDSC